MMLFINLTHFINGKSFGYTAEIQAHPRIGKHNTVIFRTKENIFIVDKTLCRGNFFIRRNMLFIRTDAPEFSDGPGRNIPGAL